jgi:hypothetical protein
MSQLLILKEQKDQLLGDRAPHAQRSQTWYYLDVAALAVPCTALTHLPALQLPPQR